MYGINRNIKKIDMKKIAKIFELEDDVQVLVNIATMVYEKRKKITNIPIVAISTNLFQKDQRQDAINVEIEKTMQGLKIVETFDEQDAKEFVRILHAIDREVADESIIQTYIENLSSKAFGENKAK